MTTSVLETKQDVLSLPHIPVYLLTPYMQCNEIANTVTHKEVKPYCQSILNTLKNKRIALQALKRPPTSQRSHPFVTLKEFPTLNYQPHFRGMTGYIESINC